jgi:hypothetical protein
MAAAAAAAAAAEQSPTDAFLRSARADGACVNKQTNKQTNKLND